MKKILAFLFAVVISSAVLAGTIDLTARVGDNSRSITKTLSKTITTTGAGLHLQTVSVPLVEVTNTISAGVGDAGLSYILNSGATSVDVGFAADTYVMRLASGEFAILPLSTNTAAVYLKSVTGTNTVEIYVTER